MLFRFIAASLLLAAVVEAGNRTAIDVSIPIDGSTAQCMAAAGYSLAVVRAWRSGGEPDVNAPATLASFRGAGMDTDAYLFPCVGKDPVAQVQGMIQPLKAAGVAWNMTWLDVEENPNSVCITRDLVLLALTLQLVTGQACDWSSTDFTANCAYLQSLVSAGQSNGLSVGIYTSIRIWNLFFGGANSCTSIGSGGVVPLWYPRYNNDPTCNAFVPFGGWSHAVWHQWVGDGTVCGSDVDLNIEC